MQNDRRFRALSTAAMLVAVVISASWSGSMSTAVAQSQSVTRQLVALGTTSFPAGTIGVEGLQFPEFPRGLESEADAANGGGSTDQSGIPVIINRSKSEDNHGKGRGEDANHEQANGARGSLLKSFNGLNLRNQRLANGGNQFTVEPPDQALCVGNGYVVESVNDVLRVFDTSGNALSGVIDLNSFYGFPAQFDRTTGLQGPFVTDPVCHFDAATQRFYHVVLTLEVEPVSGNFTGRNSLDIAVSSTANPLDPWKTYRLWVQDDGTDGTPNHGCFVDPNPAAEATNPGACIGDYPHIGMDRNGLYITTNEYDLFGPEFQSANIYAISKRDLAAGVANPTVVQFETKDQVHGQPGFTVWPAVSPDNQFANDKGGTEYFLSSNAAEEANEVPGGSSSREIIVWALTNTRSLSRGGPALDLVNKVVPTKSYSIPPRADQKLGSTPLRDCVNDTTIATPFGTGCWNLFFVDEPAHDEAFSPLDANDTRMQQVSFAQGKLYGALDTAVRINGEVKDGIFWFVFDPSVEDGILKASVERQGYLAVPGNNVTYPAIGVNRNGKGVMAFTLVGKDYYPTAAYATISADGVGAVQIAAAGLGPQDGFTGYKSFVGDPPRPRWGDYGAAAVDGSNIWIASEYIAQTCTLQQYLTGAIGSCGGTRVALGNWATRVSLVHP